LQFALFHSGTKSEIKSFPALPKSLLIPSHCARLQLETARLRRIRFVIAGTCVVAVITMLSYMFLGQSVPDDPEAYDMHKLFISAVAEFVAFGCFLAYFGTFLPSFAHTRIHAVLIQREARLVPEARISLSATSLEDVADNSLTRRTQRLESAVDRFVDRAVQGVLTAPLIEE
jgi:hypothetical protein